VFQTLNRLSQLEVANAEVGMHADGGGLYLQVTKTASGQLDTVFGCQRQMGLGPLTEVKLADASRRLPSAGSSGWTESIRSKRARALGGWQRQAA
jgi:hypothetical protein